MTPAQVDVAVLTVAAGADTLSSHFALSRCPGCYEANPVMTEPALSILVKSAAVAGVTLGCERLRKDGHRGWAKVLRWTVAGVWLGLAGNNLRVSR